MAATEVTKTVRAEVICFADYQLDLRRGCLLRAGTEIALRPKCYELLRYLVENAGRLVPKDELVQALWPDVVATDESLSRCVSDLRSALQDQRHEFIKTVRGRGFLFAVPVSQAAAEPETGETSTTMPTAAPATPADRSSPISVSTPRRWRRDVWRNRLPMQWQRAVAVLVVVMIGSSVILPSSGLLASRVAPARAPASAHLPAAKSNPVKPKVGDDVVGHSFSGSVSAEGFTVTLPEGNWTGLAAVPINDQNAIGTSYFLGRIEAGRLVGAVRISAGASKDHPGTGFRQANCQIESRDNIFLVKDGCAPAGSQAWWQIQNYYSIFDQWADRTVYMLDLDRGAGQSLMAQGIRFPQDFVRLEFNLFEKWGFLEVDYLFTTEVDGITSKAVANFRESDWHSAHIVRFPEKMAYAHKLELWGKEIWPGLKAAFAAKAPASSG